MGFRSLKVAFCFVASGRRLEICETVERIPLGLLGLKDITFTVIPRRVFLATELSELLCNKDRHHVVDDSTELTTATTLEEEYLIAIRTIRLRNV